MATNNAIDLSAQGVAYYNGTGTFSGLDGSTSGFALTSNGTGVAPSFQAINSGSSYGGTLSATPLGNPADNTTYYLMHGQVLTGSTLSSRTNGFYVITKNMTLNNVYGSVVVTGTLGTTENATLFIRKNDTSNTNITTTLQFSAATNTFNNTSIGLSLVAGDYIVFGLTTPAFSTNPTAVILSLRFSE